MWGHLVCDRVTTMSSSSLLRNSSVRTGLVNSSSGTFLCYLFSVTFILWKQASNVTVVTRRRLSHSCFVLSEVSELFPPRGYSGTPLNTGLQEGWSMKISCQPPSWGRRRPLSFPLTCPCLRATGRQLGSLLCLQWKGCGTWMSPGRSFWWEASGVLLSTTLDY